MLLDLQSCQSRDELARVLGYKPSALAYILYQIPDPDKYTTFTIKKKDGSDRTIQAPVEKLKALQSRLSQVLYGCIDDVKGVHQKRYSSIRAYTKDYSIAENAKTHSCKKFVLNIDIEDFFDSIHIGRVRGFFSKDLNFSLNENVALTIAQIACHNGSLPQGAPSSPVISNLVGSLLDARLAKFSNRHGCAYSRYADDLTFSTNLNNFPEELAVSNDSAQGWVVADELSSRITNAGYSIKASKTRMSVKRNRQVVTGLVVNSKVNVPNEYYKATRSMCHKLLRGHKPHRNMFFSNSDEDDVQDATLPYIEGRLSYIHFIRDRFDTRLIREKQDNKSAFAKTYRDFLLFKIFYRSHRPLIIPEGDSDRIYIRLAAKKLLAGDSDFTETIDGKEVLSFRLLNYTQRLTEVVGLAGGTGNIIKTLVQLRDFIRSHGVLIPSNPVIICIDNDQGASSLVKQIKNLYGASVSSDNSEPFIKLKHGLYVVRTPSLPGKPETFIESFLPAAVLDTEIDGKTFCPDDNFDTSAHFGKVRLAQIVTSKAATIDLTGYSLLLDRFRAVWADWAS